MRIKLSYLIPLCLNTIIYLINLLQCVTVLLYLCRIFVWSRLIHWVTAVSSIIIIIIILRFFHHIREVLLISKQLPPHLRSLFWSFNIVKKIVAFILFILATLIISHYNLNYQSYFEIAYSKEFALLVGGCLKLALVFYNSFLPLNYWLV